MYVKIGDALYVKIGKVLEKLEKYVKISIIRNMTFLFNSQFFDSKF